MLMIKGLIFLSIIPFFGIRRVICRICVRSVFGETDAAVRISGVIFIEKLIILVEIAQIPAEIEVIAVDIRNLQDRIINFQHEDIGHRRKTCRIQSVAELVQLSVILEKILIDRTCRRDLVRQSPDRDRRMVITLCDEFPHLRQSILPAVRHVHGNVRNLSPDDDTVLVTEVIELLCMLVVGEPQGIRTDLPDDLHIRLMIFIRQGIALPLQVLMAGDASKRIAPAVQEEALLRITGKDTAAETRADFIAGRKAGCSRIEIRVFGSVPETDVFYHEFCPRMSFF